MDANQQYQREILNYLKVDGDIFLYWKGRVALYALLKALGVKKGDEIIMPAFTCVVVSNAVIYLGAKPIYVDIDPLTFNIDPEKVKQAITSKTKCILAQNTFGLSCDVDALIAIAKPLGISVFEDCTHGFGGTYKGKPNGTIADAAFYSTQWNKPFSTGIGGFAYVKSPYFAAQVSVVNKNLQSPSQKQNAMLTLMLKAGGMLANPKLYWPLVKTYRWLSKHNLVIGSSSSEELEKPKLPEGFFMGHSIIQANKGILGLEKLDEEISHRKAIAKLYNLFLLELGLKPVYEPDYAEHTYLKFPLLVKNRTEFMALAFAEKIELGEWFVSPIHPIENNLENWEYFPNSNPIAEEISAQMINLPTSNRTSLKDVGRIIKFLHKNKHFIIR